MSIAPTPLELNPTFLDCLAGEPLAVLQIADQAKSPLKTLQLPPS
jgi:hypothetical protein